MWLDAAQPSSLLELAAGTGNITEHLARRVEHITAVDASPEVLALNRDKLGTNAARVRYVVDDVFEWAPSARFDALVFGFWISHIPRGRWDEFWSQVQAALVPGGALWFCDDAPPELGWAKGMMPRPDDPLLLRGDGTINRATDVHERSLPNGRTYRLIKRFYRATELERDLLARGFDAAVATTEWAFAYGSATYAGS